MIAWLAVSALGADRFALVAGASDGGAHRPLLQHTAADARRFAEVLLTVGGVEDEDLRLLVDPSVGEVREALGALARVVEGRERSEVVVYFTGHADEDGLQFGPDELTYAELRGAIEAIGASVRVVILDGCSSGAVLRSKGGVHAPPIEVAPSLDGVAYLTSSAAGEVSQESDVLGGSFFTHSLTTGLRGAADGSGDGRVTLAEAYQYAHASTLALTERTLGGAQHASFDLRLAGAGDVVLTELDTAGGRLVIPEDLGAVTVRRAGGEVIAELPGDRDRDAVLAVTPGRYELVVQDGGQRLGGTMVVASAPRTVARSELEALPAPVVRRKGGWSPARIALLGTAVAGYAGAAASFGIYNRATQVRISDETLWEELDRAEVREQAGLHAFFFTGSVAVLSTTTFVLLGGGR